MADQAPEPRLTRRHFLGQGFTIMAGCACLPLLYALGGCQRSDSDPASVPLIVPLAMLPLDERTNLEHDGHPIELLRTSSGITARSLRCTHQGCKVRWHEDDQQYICPCHEGKFDAQGEVVYGMPRRPLAVLAVTLQGDVVIVDP